MKTVQIIRVEKSKYGTFGLLKVDGECFCVTLEPEDKFNAEHVSCIPLGQYLCKPYSSKKYHEVYQVTEVRGRSNILFHPGNVAEDTHGCILLASSFGKLTVNDKRVRAILNSGDTFNKFKELIGNNNFKLIITELKDHSK